jgi:acyl dehydratase
MTGQPPPLERRIDLPQMIAYAGATWDWHRIHYDQAYLDSKQLPAPVVDGQVLGALLAEQLLGWAGPAWRLAALDFRFANLVFAGETVRCELEVTDRDERRIAVAGRVVVVEDGRAAVSTASAELVRR